MIKFVCISLLLNLLHTSRVQSQDKQETEIKALIANYSLARENRDTVLLKKILTADIDQLVSNGEWRYGIRAAVEGMQRSSASNPGTRTLTVEKIRFMDPANAIADARYEIKNANGTTRKMWSSFVVVFRDNNWKISAIRNMLPSGL